jgi:hypothetical protein
MGGLGQSLLVFFGPSLRDLQHFCKDCDHMCIIAYDRISARKPRAVPPARTSVLDVKDARERGLS